MRGHITKRGDSWTAIVDLPPDPLTGKRRRKRVTARTKREVETQVAELIHKAETGFTDAGKLTVREFFDRWLESAAPTLRPPRPAATETWPGCTSSGSSVISGSPSSPPAMCNGSMPTGSPPGSRRHRSTTSTPFASGARSGRTLGAADAQRHRGRRSAAPLLPRNADLGYAPGGGRPRQSGRR